jgi:hypothetical protein
MKRTLLALPLLLCAAGAFAADPAPTEATEASCPKAQAEQEKAQANQATPAATQSGTPAPARARGATATRGTPRWHSMLPGMFR